MTGSSVNNGGLKRPSKHQVGGSIPSGIATQKLSDIKALDTERDTSARCKASIVLCEMRRENAPLFGKNLASPPGFFQEGPQTDPQSPTGPIFPFWKKTRLTLARAACLCPDCIAQVIGVVGAVS